MAYDFIKRAADFWLALALLVLLSPLLLLIAISLKMSGEGEIFYLQERVGYKNRRFEIWKFATMLKNSPQMPGGEITLRNDPRITPFGRYLRISKLNELPQLINVLCGEMSFVGPRPLMPVSFEQYSPEVQAIVYESRPGLTGIGSVIFRDEEKWVTAGKTRGIDPKAFYRELIFPYKGALERWYRENKSFRVDFLLLFLTAWVLLSPGSDLPYRVFDNLPPQPDWLQGLSD